MATLEAAIQGQDETPGIFAWMAGSSPAMTIMAVIPLSRADLKTG